MTKAQLVERLAKSAGLTKKEAQALLDGLVSTIVASVKKGDPVKIPDLGTFKKVQSKARMGRNPQTGEPVKIPARKKVRFTVAKSFKDTVLGARK
jgi:DNA-binding protein HU-beta